MTPEERFFYYAVQDGAHWMWTGPTLGREVCDYGRLYMGEGTKPRLQQAHRWAYEFFIGEIPAGLEPDHTCEITLCTNPWHLDLVPHGINVRRGTRWPGAPAGRKLRTKRDVPRETCPRCGGLYITVKAGKRGTQKRCPACYNASVREWTRQTGRVTGEGSGARNREKTHCPAGHEYTPENTYINPKKGGRDCLKCRRQRNADARARARERKQAA